MTTPRSTADLLTALENHFLPFTDADGNFTPTTVANGLNKAHASHPNAKGTVISTFNATHASSNIICPVTGAKIRPDVETGYAKYLHLGTTRVWNADGSINEDRWTRLVNFVTEGQTGDNKIVRQSKFNAYLSKCYKEDPCEPNTGRNNACLFSSKPAQGFAATSAWNEVYALLTCGWVPVNENAKQLEPYISLKVIRLFFENTKAALKLAEDGILPVKKPEVLDADDEAEQDYLIRLNS